MNEKNIEISIVIPCLNEEKTIAICVKKCLNTLVNLDVNGEIIVVDNGSIDNSVKEAMNSGAKVITCKDKGYGNALKCGFKNALGKFIIMGDADNTYDFHEITKLYQAILSTNADIITSSRFQGNIEKGAMPFLHKYIGTPILTKFTNLLFNLNISDLTSGFKIFKRDSYNKISCFSGGMDFVAELLIEFKIKGFTISEIPTNLYKDIDARKPHLNTFKDGFQTLFIILKKYYNKNKSSILSSH